MVRKMTTKRKRVRKTVRRRRARNPRSAQLKHHKQTFKLQPQLLQSNPGTGNAVILGVLGGSAPITAVSTAVASTTGFLNNWDFGLACSHALEDLASVGNWTALYDAYRITKVTATIEYCANSAGPQGSALLPTLYMYWDQDDDAPPTSIEDVNRKTGHRRFTPTSSKRSVSFSYRPTIRQSVTTSANANSPYQISSTAGSPWLNCGGDGPKVLHYAFKLWVSDFYAIAGNNAVADAFRVHWKYDVQFRSPIRND